MRTKEEWQDELKLWKGVNPILEKQARNELSNIKDQEDKIIYDKHEVVKSKVTEVFFETDVNKDGVTDEKDLIEVSKQIAEDASKPKYSWD